MLLKEAIELHLFIVIKLDNLDAEVTTNLVDFIRHKMIKARIINDCILH